jgi:hypothetical protein
MLASGATDSCLERPRGTEEAGGGGGELGNAEDDRSPSKAAGLEQELLTGAKTSPACCWMAEGAVVQEGSLLEEDGRKLAATDGLGQELRAGAKTSPFWWWVGEGDELDALGRGFSCPDKRDAGRDEDCSVCELHAPGEALKDISSALIAAASAEPPSDFADVSRSGVAIKTSSRVLSRAAAAAADMLPAFAEAGEAALAPERAKTNEGESRLSTAAGAAASAVEIAFGEDLQDLTSLPESAASRPAFSTAGEAALAPARAKTSGGFESKAWSCGAPDLAASTVATLLRSKLPFRQSRRGLFLAAASREDAPVMPGKRPQRREASEVLAP